MKFVPSWLQQLGQSAQSLPTLQALPGANAPIDPRTMADVLAEMYSAQDDLSVADRLSGAEYIPNSGIGGALAMGLQAFAGKKLRDKSQGKLSDLLREKSELMSRAEREELERAAKAEEAKHQRSLERIREQERAKAENRAPARPQFSNGLIFDPNTGEVTRTPFYREPESGQRVTFGAPIEAIDPATGKPAFFRPTSDGRMVPVDGAAPRPAAGNAPSGYRMTADGNLEPIPGGPADPTRKTEGPKQLTAEAATKLALLENARREATAYLQAVSPDGKEFKDIAASLPENARRRNSAIRAKLRAESGATITDSEIEGEESRYGPKFWSSDETNAAAAMRMVEDIDNQIAALTGQAPEPFAFSQAEQATAPASEPRAVNPKTGEVLVLRNGKWVKE